MHPLSISYDNYRVSTSLSGLSYILVYYFILLLNQLATKVMAYAAFTLDGFDDQERNLTFVKADFQVLKLKFMPASLSRISISS